MVINTLYYYILLGFIVKNGDPMVVKIVLGLSAIFYWVLEFRNSIWNSLVLRQYSVQGIANSWYNP